MKMKSFILSTIMLLACSLSASAQKQTMTVHKTDGTTVVYKSSQVLRVEFTEGNGTGTGSIGGHEYVDLGLPSGTLWATCNIGATTPEGFGNEFAWGETAPKDEYKEENYFDWVLGLTEDDEANFPKYNDHGGLTTLLPEDDAATVNWGNSWCLPSYEQCEELKANCTSEIVLKNNIECLLLKSNLNGNYIYLPYTGTGAWWGYKALYLENSIAVGACNQNRAMGINYVTDPHYALFPGGFGLRWLRQSARAVVKK